MSTKTIRGAVWPRVTRTRCVLRTFVTFACALLLASSADAALRNRYSFTADASDSMGSAHGQLVNATISGGAVVLNGTSGHVNLPNNLVTGLTSITIEVWLTENNSGIWARIFDFGNNSAGEDLVGSGTQYMFLTPRNAASGGTLRGAYTTSGSGAPEQIISAAAALAVGSQKHLVWATDGATQIGRLYVDGVLVASNTSMSITPAALGPTVNNWIGRSQFSADSFLNASVTEFRIYDNALTPADIAQNFALGPEIAAQGGPVTVTAEPQNQSVSELQPAAFSVGYNGARPVNVQWFRDNAPIAGATNDTYTISSAALADNGAVFYARLTNVLTNVTFTAQSSNATLNVLQDLTGPSVVLAASVYPTNVLIEFSEKVRADTATNTASYAITNGGVALAVTRAALDASQRTVILTTAPQMLGAIYTLTINGPRDLSVASNSIAANTQVTFTALDYVVTNVGVSAIAGILTPAGGGYDFSGGGPGVGGTNDQFTYAYRLANGDFDLQLRLGSITLSNAWARAGLMARESFATNSIYAASFATPDLVGCFFSARTNTGGSAAMAGSFPVNYPDTWLRLRRAGNVFQGFASLDGITWNFLGSASIPMPPNIYVGLSLDSASASAPATAQFRNIGPGTGTLATNAPLPFEPLGPGSRSTALAFTEIMYNPPSTWGGTNNLEFVELWNSGMVTEDLSGHRLTGDISYSFPSNTLIRPGQFLVVARDPGAAQSFYGLPFLGPYTNTLGNDSGTLRLVNELDARILEIEYADESPWTPAADGTGHSLVLNRPSYGENDPRAWAASDVIGGSPGRREHWGAEPGRSVVINEFLANTDAPSVDTVELFNTSTQPVDLSGAWLSDDSGTNKFRIADNTVLAGRSALAFDQVQLGFSLSASGERILLVNSNRTRVLDAITFGPQANGVARGRYPDGAPHFYELSAKTPGLPNAAPLQRPVVINELMYNPISGSDSDEYLELHNRGASPVSLAGWRLDGGVRYTFPGNALISAGGYLVVGENLTNLLAKYPQLNATNTFGNYSGSLANSGERVTLSFPEITLTTNGQNIVTNISYVVVNDVTYRDGGRWGVWSDGGGSSLELVDPRAENRFAASWADSDETAKAGWTTIDVTNILENGQTPAMIFQGTYNGQASRLEFFLNDPGEVILDDLAFLNNNGPNLIANGDFASGTNGFLARGTCRQSFAENGVGTGGSAALHIVATDRGDAGPNKISTAIATTVLTNAPNTGTVRAQVRWLKGSPYIMIRLRGHWMEVSHRLNVPASLGTPGLPNSRLVPNSGPVISDVAHSPVLPAAGQAVVVTARVSDPNGVGSVSLNYRLDPATSFAATPMNDSGTGADAVAGDFIYSGTVPGQSTGLVAFYISSADGAPAPAASRFPNDAPVRECMVRWGESTIAGSLGTYRLWVNASNVTFWNNREKNANDSMDATFVYGNSRVIYNAKTLYSGSPFHAPGYNGPLGSFVCDYEVNFESDDAFLGSSDFVLTAYDTTSTSLFFADKSGQVDLTGNWIARKLGQPFNYRRHMHMMFNGQRRGAIYDDAQQPNREWVEQFFPDDSDGELRKIEDWFEFADDAVTHGITTSTIERFNKSTGGVDPKRYRFTWRPRATDDPNNWYSVTNLMIAANDTANPNYVNVVRAWMDVPNFLAPIVTHHLCGDWDSYGYERGKNMYAYKPASAGWRLLMWDIELGLGGANSRAPTDTIYNIHDPSLRNLITNTPAFHRQYLAAFLEAMNTSFAPGAVDVLLDERYAAFRANDVIMQSPQFIKNFMSQRRAYLLTQIPAGQLSLNTNFISVSASNLVTLSGTAPLLTDEITVNGITFPVTWTTITNWTIRVPIDVGTNFLTVQLSDRSGQPLGSTNVTAVYAGAAPGQGIVFNEIMFNPTVLNAEYVELFNASTNFTYDLSGWRVNGLDYTFRSGAFLAPRSFLLLAKSAAAVATAYGSTVPVFDMFDGNFQLDGETLSLIKPGIAPDQDVVVDRVRYEPNLPWPQQANGGGAAAQLLDATQDNSRAGNWAASTEWRFASATGIANSSRVYLYLNGVGDIFIDDIMLVSGATPGVGTNWLRDGDFESPLAGNWNIPAANAQSQISATNVHSGNGSLHIISTNPAVAVVTLISQDISPALSPLGTTYSVSYWFRPKAATPNLTFRISSGTLNSTVTTAPLTATPGVANSTITPLPPFPNLWLNEVQPINTTGMMDNLGDREPWIEIYNPGTNGVSLDGLYLSDNYTNLAQWAFPSNLTINPGQFKIVYLDGEPGESTLADWHTSFRLMGSTGSVAISRLLSGSSQVVDYLNFQNITNNRSYGSFPDGQPFFRQPLFNATPGGTNNAASPPLFIFINEWMAANNGVIRDPVDNEAEDWFELYNPNPVPFDLGGHYLTDELTNKFQYQVPNNGQYVIPAGGYMLVWADGETAQNAPNRELHAGFNLRAAGEAIGVFAADGRLIDAVTFGQQTNNVSMGRNPDGSTNIVFLSTSSPRSANAALPVAVLLTAPVVNGAAVTLYFTSQAGAHYRVQYKDNLGQAWLDLPGDVTATGPISSKTDTNVGQRFYRVMSLP